MPKERINNLNASLRKWLKKHWGKVIVTIITTTGATLGGIWKHSLDLQNASVDHKLHMDQYNERVARDKERAELTALINEQAAALRELKGKYDLLSHYLIKPDENAN